MSPRAGDRCDQCKARRLRRREDQRQHDDERAGKIPADQQQTFEVGADQDDHDPVAVEIGLGDLRQRLFGGQVER